MFASKRKGHQMFWASAVCTLLTHKARRSLYLHAHLHTHTRVLAHSHTPAHVHLLVPLFSLATGTYHVGSRNNSPDLLHPPTNPARLRFRPELKSVALDITQAFPERRRFRIPFVLSCTCLCPSSPRNLCFIAHLAPV